jgi:glycosyltransferase involved in cell wall biosynthesis
MFCSIIIATIGRPTLTRSVESALNQQFDPGQYEIIVVNDAGRSLSDMSFLDSGRVRLVDTWQRERCVARNTGAALAQGDFINFLDDDDWLFPTAMQTFQQVVQAHPQAGWVYGGALLRSRSGKVLQSFRPHFQGNIAIQMMAGEWVPLGMSAIRSTTFFQVEAFPPNMTAGQDKHLQRRISLVAEFYGSPDIVVNLVRGDQGSVTDYGTAPLLSRIYREVVLDQPGAFTRLRESTHTGYWAGKLVRTYLTSMLWNLAKKRPGKSLDRLAQSALAGLLAAPHLLNRQFWQALSHEHQGITYAESLAADRAANSPASGSQNGGSEQ